MKKLFSKAKPGDFIQLNWSKERPHSAIVYSVTSDGTTWIQNNGYKKHRRLCYMETNIFMVQISK